jgi:uncharacterized protein (TIGR00661 family)
MSQNTQKTILFCPLDWGLGHIARDLPLIREFSRNGHRVVVAASEKLCDWVKSETPDIETVFFDGPNIFYSGSRGAFSEIIFQLPGLLLWPGKEKKRIRELTALYHPDLIVSDNRYGARHPKITSVIITHQLCIQLPKMVKWAEYPLHLFVKYLIGKFDQCWIPDFPKADSLAGNLVHQYRLPKNAILIGPLSRFDNTSEENNKEFQKKTVLGILSGPEPQRSIFEHLLRKNLEKQQGLHTLITGQTVAQNAYRKGANLVLIDHQPTREMLRLIQDHKVIISRSGYSTIMDMHFLNRAIIIVPTPGQTEQEYLSRFHHGHRHLRFSQKQIPESDFEKVVTALKTTNSCPNSPLNFRSVLRNILRNPSGKPEISK